MTVDELYKYSDKFTKIKFLSKREFNKRPRAGFIITDIHGTTANVVYYDFVDDNTVVKRKIRIEPATAVRIDGKFGHVIDFNKDYMTVLFTKDLVESMAESQKKR